jgi:hypothetical protein
MTCSSAAWPNIETHGSPQAQEQHGQIGASSPTIGTNVAWRNRMAGAISVLSFFAARRVPGRLPPLLLTRGGRMSPLTILIVVVLVLAAAWLVRHF